MRILEKLERESLTTFSKVAAEITPVFIIGLPRSGTTLLYQLLLNYFDWSYFTRWSNFFYLTPVAAYKLQRLLFPEPKHFAYASDYGRFKKVNFMSTAWSPVEGHAIWRRWFSQFPDDAFRGNLDCTVIEEIQSMISGFSKISGKPFLNKNGVHSVRVLALSQVFPRGFFIVLKRQSQYVAQSLYIARTRRRIKQPQDNWWGTKPKEYEYLKNLDPLRQAVGQTRAIEAAMERELSCASGHIRINYQDVCEQPAKVINDIYESCVTHGIELRKKNYVEPKPFPLQNERKVSEREFDKIKSLLLQKCDDFNCDSAFFASGTRSQSW